MNGDGEHARDVSEVLEFVSPMGLVALAIPAHPRRREDLHTALSAQNFVRLLLVYFGHRDILEQLGSPM